MYSSGVSGRSTWLNISFIGKGGGHFFAALNCSKPVEATNQPDIDGKPGSAFRMPARRECPAGAAGRRAAGKKMPSTKCQRRCQRRPAPPGPRPVFRPAPVAWAADRRRCCSLSDRRRRRCPGERATPRPMPLLLLLWAPSRGTPSVCFLTRFSVKKKCLKIDK
jgi:hypothetical protein